MTSTITGDFDYLLKLVVIGGKHSLIKIRASEKPIYSPDSPLTNSVMNPSQQLAYNLQHAAST